MSAIWQDTIEKAIAIRKELHQHPELGWNEVNTANTIRNILTDLDIEWRVCAKTGTLARIGPLGNKKTERNQPHIALRGDIDALPIFEKSESDYRSKIDGCMHACGHDGHTAVLLAAASWIKKHEASLKAPVSLVFQPAEEGGHGAAKMIEDGALEGVDEIYGWHNWPAIPFGEMLCPEGIVMCGNGTFKITVKGKGGHASQPELCRDPVLAASAINLSLQQIISRKLSPKNIAVVSVTSINAPSAATVIPDTAELSGSIRVPDQSTREQINTSIREISHGIAQAYGVTCDIDIDDRYQATINHRDQAANMRRAWSSLWGEDSLCQSVSPPIMASEDFSYYLNTIPGAYALIGADDGDNHDIPCHNATYDFNDRLIAKVTRLYSELVGIPAPG